MAERRALMRAYGMNMHAYVRTCGVNRHADVCACGLNNRVLGARLMGANSLLHMGGLFHENFPCFH
jgi:hypothetical protein